MRKRCGGQKCFQEYPKKGKLKDNMNPTLNKLLAKLRNEQGTVYAYVLTTIKSENGQFFQWGCAPNFQGGLITLCTCKHFMRTWRDTFDWKGVWIAGLTSINLMGDNRNYLFYLIKVAESFPSLKAIWEHLSEAVRSTKNARINPLGDIYEPKQDTRDEFDYSYYYPPVKSHVHEVKNQWREDIGYNDKYGKRPALLVGGLEYSFLWSLPIIHLKNRHPRTKLWDMKGFRRTLCSAS